MKFFSQFPTIHHKGSVLKDLTIRIDFVNRIKNNAALFEYVQIQNGERPEDIAYRYYNDSNLYWIVLILNDITHIHDWLLTDSQLNDYIIKKYGSANMHNVHHYELEDGTWVNSTTPFIKSTVTNYMYEQNLNEEKRKIKILKLSYISQVLDEYKKELNR